MSTPSRNPLWLILWWATVAVLGVAALHVAVSLGTSGKDPLAHQIYSAKSVGAFVVALAALLVSTPRDR